MIMFEFRVNKSFLKYTNHPITIPQAYHPLLLKNVYGGAGKKTISARVIPPKGRILDGKIYYGKAGYGPYYQIKVLGAYPSDYFGNLKIGESIWVSIAKSGQQINVKILSRKQIRELAEKLLSE